MRKPPRRAAGRARALGLPTRGTTAPNRLRRVDRWIVGTQSARLRDAVDPLVVDLGYGTSPVTTVELAARLADVRKDVRVLGLEIDPDRVTAAAGSADPPRLEFARGGFELAGRRPVLVRALNVLRQYDEAAATDAWTEMCGRLGPGGLLVERLPKALIHHNVPGQPVHALLRAFDRAWAVGAPYQTFGPRQRWSAAVERLAEQGWPVVGGRSRWRLGEITLRWSSVSAQ